MKQTDVPIFALVFTALLHLSGMLSAAAANPSEDPAWDSTVDKYWPSPFEVIQIPSSIDGSLQPAYAYQSKQGEPMPLVVSLHTWSGTYRQKDPLAEKMKVAGFHFIHPHFRGPNRTPESCASPLALQDIDDAIAYCLQNWTVDPNRIYVVGVSGGGHATCAAYFKSRHPIAAFYAWVPITDLGAWYLQSKQRRQKYAGDIEKICGGAFDPGTARERSPLFMDPPGRSAPLHLYAGINDGYNGSVPITHSINLYNKLSDKKDRLSCNEIVALVSKTVEPTGQKISGRDIYDQTESATCSLTIFEGGHEMLVDFAAERIIEAAGHP